VRLEATLVGFEARIIQLAAQSLDRLCYCGPKCINITADETNSSSFALRGWIQPVASTDNYTLSVLC